jgi:hypothetical protein
MQIDNETLGALHGDEGALSAFFKQYAEEVFFQAKLFPVLSERRLADAHIGWFKETHPEYVRVAEPELPEGYDHFKLCGHLTYWLRRATPLWKVEDIRELFTFPGGSDITPDIQEFRDLLFAYGNEYLAFDFGFQFCLFYEMDRGSGRAASLILPSEYITTTCNFLKFKNVGPHGLFLAFKSLFHG